LTVDENGARTSKKFIRFIELGAVQADDGEITQFPEFARRFPRTRPDEHHSRRKPYDRQFVDTLGFPRTVHRAKRSQYRLVVGSSIEVSRIEANQQDALTSHRLQ